jgi:outer membrane lipoprotein carrier protein
LLALSALASDARLDDLLKQVEARYNRAKTLEVLFQEQYTRPGQIRRSESGVLMLRKPGRMRWDYSQPKGKQFLSDGTFLYLYTPDSNRAEKTRLRETADMRAPLAFLLGKLNFQKEFRNIQGTPDAAGAGVRITAEPKTDNLPYSQVEFAVTSDGRIREVKVTAYDKSILDFIFDQEKMDPPLDSKLFQFQLPAGAQLVEGDQ